MAWKTLAALAIVVSGAVAAFAVYSFGWHDNSTANEGGASKRTDPFVKTVRDARGTYRVYRPSTIPNWSGVKPSV